MEINTSISSMAFDNPNKHQRQRLLDNMLEERKEPNGLHRLMVKDHPSEKIIGNINEHMIRYLRYQINNA